MHVGDVVQRCLNLANQRGESIAIHARASVGSGYIRISGVDATAQAIWFDAIPEALWVATATADLPTYWHAPAAGIDIMQQIRREFDPHGRLNPQRFVV